MNSLIQPNLISPSLPQNSLSDISLDLIEDDLDIYNMSIDNNFITNNSMDSLLRTNSINIKNFLDDFLTENQKTLSSKIITLHFPFDNPEELYYWAKYATIEELLKIPSITYFDER